MDDIAKRLRIFYESMNNPPSPELPDGSAVILEAADEIEALMKQAETYKTIAGLLRSQLRVLGHIPMVSENNDVANAEYAMRNARRKAM